MIHSSPYLLGLAAVNVVMIFLQPHFPPNPTIVYGYVPRMKPCEQVKCFSDQGKNSNLL